MKASELMIGDLVLVHKPTCKGHRVDYINEMEEEIGADGEIYDVCDIRPIPLTPEILEKNGFKKDIGDEECWACKIGWFTPHKYNKKFIPVSWEVEICGKPNSFDGVIKFVHELQHCFKLVGIKKDIVL